MTTRTITRPGQRAHRNTRILTAALFATFLLAVLAMPAKAFAASEVHLVDGQTFDLSQASDATTVHVDGAGDYRLTGSSSKVLVDIRIPQGQSADIVLDGVTLTPDNGAPGASDEARSPITVRNTGGEVSLTSAAGTSSTITGFGDAAAIQKTGTKTKLTFKTEDLASTGTIVARVDANALGACAIGAYDTQKTGTPTSTGNIVFESGSVEAYGALGDGSATTGGAGIGSGYGCSVNGITVKGGSIHSEGATGIGGGTRGDGRNIKVEGGTVEVYGSVTSGGAGIGGGYGGSANGIAISGGSVRAEGATGIGGGTDGDGLNIKISGGSVEARGRYTGIGGGKCTGTLTDSPYTWFGEATVDISGGMVNTSCTGSDAGVGIGGWKSCVAGKYELNGRGHVSITGGTVSAKGAGGLAGIGTGLCGSLDYISISGGSVYAEGSGGAPGIGMSQDVQDANSRIRRISISGGTTEAVAGNGATYSIGTLLGDVSAGSREAAPVYISGGNIKAEKGFNVTPQQSAGGSAVHRYQVDVETYGHETDLSSSDVSSLVIRDANGGDGSALPYGFSDMHPFATASSAATFYLWLPDCDERTIELGISPKTSMPHGDADFSNSSQSADGMTLYPRTQVKLIADTDNQGEGVNGSITLAQGLDTIDYKRAVRDGKKLVGYSLDRNGATLVLDAQGRLIPHAVDGNGAALADSNGCFTGSSEKRYNGLTLYAQWEDTNGVVQFDPNKPCGVSSTVRGDFASRNVDAGNQIQLTLEPDLDGYTFTGWNAKPDGSGEPYDSNDYLDITEIGEVVTLYAQWQRSDYQICFMPNDGELDHAEASYCQRAFFNFDTVLDTPGMTLDLHHLTGWNTEPSGAGEAFKLGEEVNNLATSPQQTVYLYAQWEPDTYTVSYDGNGAEGSMDADTFESGIGRQLPNTGFSYAGYTFAGWNTAADGSGTSYAADGSYPDLAAAGGSVTLYAQWKANEVEPNPEPDPEPVTPKPEPKPTAPEPDAKPSPQPGSSSTTQISIKRETTLPDTGDSPARPIAALAALAAVIMLALASRLRRDR